MSEIHFIEGVQLSLQQCLNTNNAEMVRLLIFHLKESIESIKSRTEVARGSITERLYNSVNALIDSGPVVDEDILKYAEEVVKYLAVCVLRSKHCNALATSSIEPRSPLVPDTSPATDTILCEAPARVQVDIQPGAVNVLKIKGSNLEGSLIRTFEVSEMENSEQFHLSSNPEYQSRIDSINSETASVCSGTDYENDIETNMTSNLLQLFGKVDVVPAVEHSLKWDRPSRHGLANSAPIVPDMFRDLTLRSFIFLVNQRLDELRTVMAVKAKGRNSRKSRRSS